jgi:hypothetical protein
MCALVGRVPLGSNVVRRDEQCGDDNAYILLVVGNN